MTDDAATNTNGGRTRTGRRAAYLLLLIPFVALLWVPFYAAATPQAAGMPFFYWYQLLWVPIVAVVSWCAYLLSKFAQGGPPAAAASSSGGPVSYSGSLPGLYGGTRNYSSPVDGGPSCTATMRPRAHSSVRRRNWPGRPGYSTSRPTRCCGGARV